MKIENILQEEVIAMNTKRIKNALLAMALYENFRFLVF